MAEGNGCGTTQELAFIIMPVLCIVSGLICLATITATIMGLFCCVMKQEKSRCGGRCLSKPTPISPIECSTPSACRENRPRNRMERTPTSCIKQSRNRSTNFQPESSNAVPHSRRNPLIKETCFNDTPREVSIPAFSADNLNAGVSKSRICEVEYTNHAKNSLRNLQTASSAFRQINSPNRHRKPQISETSSNSTFSDEHNVAMPSQQSEKNFEFIPLRDMRPLKTTVSSNPVFSDEPVAGMSTLRMPSEKNIEYIPLQDIRSLKTTEIGTPGLFLDNGGCSSAAMKVTFRKRRRSWSSPRKFNSNGTIMIRKHQDSCQPEKPESVSTKSVEDLDSLHSEKSDVRSKSTDISFESLEWDYFQPSCCFEEFNLNDSGIDQCCIHWV